MPQPCYFFLMVSTNIPALQAGHFCAGRWVPSLGALRVLTYNPCIGLGWDCPVGSVLREMKTCPPPESEMKGLREGFLRLRSPFHRNSSPSLCCPQPLLSRNFVGAVTVCLQACPVHRLARDVATLASLKWAML
jgi:hypothetical protein